MSQTKLIRDVNVRLIRALCIVHGYRRNLSLLHTRYVMDSFKGHCYVFIPCNYLKTECSSNFDKALNDTFVSDSSIDFLMEMKKRVREEVIGSMQKDLVRKSIGRINILCSDSAEVSSENYVFAAADVVITVHERTKLCIVCLVLRDIEVAVSQLLEQISKEQILYNSDDNSTLKNLEHILLNDYGLSKSGTIRTCLSSNEANKPSHELMLYYLAGETYLSESMDAKLISHELKRFTENNVAQYDSSDLFIGYNSVIRIDRRIECQKHGPSLYSDMALLFIIELMAFKDAAISRTNMKVLSKIAEKEKLSLSFIEHYSAEFGVTMPFWNVDVFRYVTAQQLARCIDQRFGTDESFKDYMDNQRFLEHRVNIKNALSTEIENKILNTIALLVFLFEAIPALYSLIITAIGPSQITSNKSIAGVSSVGLVGFSLMLIFLIIKRRNTARKT